MELAFVILDERFRTVAEFENVIDVRNEPGDVFEQGAIKLHQTTGLFEACLQAANDRGAVEAKALACLAQRGIVPSEFTSQSPHIMIGNNPDFDRDFMRRCFPTLDRCFHYRMINLSSIREVAAIASGLTAGRLKEAMASGDPGKGGVKHRALEDCKHCLRELVFYAKRFDGAGMIEELRAAGKIG